MIGVSWNTCSVCVEISAKLRGILCEVGLRVSRLCRGYQRSDNRRRCQTSSAVARSPVFTGVGGFKRPSRPAVLAGRQKSRDATVASPAAVGPADTAEMVQSATAALVSRVSAAHGGSEGVSRVQMCNIRRK